MPERPHADDEKLLEALLTGSLDAGDPAVRERLARDPELARAFAELSGFAREMERTGALRREVLAEAADLDGAPGDERVAAEVARFFDGRRASAARRGPRRALVLTGLAAAVVAAVALLWARLGPGEPASLQVLGGGGESELAPSGPVAEYGRFAWTADLPRGSAFELLVFGAEQEPWEPPLWESGRLAEPFVELPPAVAAALPDRIRLELRVVDASGGHTSPATAEVWRARE